MNEDERARLIITSVYGSPPAEDSEVYPLYLEAVNIQSEYLKNGTDAGELKKITLGDYSAEYSVNGSENVSRRIIAPNAAVLLDTVFRGIRRAEVLI